MGNNDGNKANTNRGKDSDDASSPSASLQISHYFNNLVSRSLLWNQGSSLFSRTSDNNLYNLPIMKPALTPDMIPFRSISPTAFAQSAAGNEIKKGHNNALGHIPSNRPNASYSKPKADRPKNSSTASSPPDNAVNLPGEHKGENNHEANSDEMSFHKKTADESAAVEEETSVYHMRNTNNVVPSKSSIGNSTTPAKYTSSASSSSSLEISKVGQSERSAHSDFGPAKLTQVSRVNKNARPIDVTIHIGRIEVKAIQQVESQRSTPSFSAANQMSFQAGPKSTATHMTLNDYLRKRAEGKY